MKRKHNPDEDYRYLGSFRLNRKQSKVLSIVLWLTILGYLITYLIKPLL